MNGEIGQIQEEGLSLVVPNKAQRLSGQAIGEIFPFIAVVRQGGDGPPGIFIRIVVAGRLAPVGSGDIDIKALLLRVESLRAQMPLAHAR
ncbi:hypothetical protein ES708_03039 [subsurface metagenome]